METAILVVTFVVLLVNLVMIWCLVAAPQPDDAQEDEIQMEAVRRMAEKEAGSIVP